MCVVVVVFYMFVEVGVFKFFFFKTCVLSSLLMFKTSLRGKVLKKRNDYPGNCFFPFGSSLLFDVMLRVMFACSTLPPTAKRDKSQTEPLTLLLAGVFASLHLCMNK